MKLLLTAMLSLIFCNIDALAATRYFNNYTFEAYLVSDSPSYGRIYETWYGSDPMLNVQEGQEYSIVVRNPLPVRVAAAVTVDGLNTVDGKRTSPSAGKKWLIDPYSQITIRGWQTNGSTSRKFVFSRPQHSYANWKGHYDRRDYSQNLGVIGVAYFWNSHELAAALTPPRNYGIIEEENELAESQSRGESCFSCDRYRSDKKAGTGMGRHERNYVTEVPFHFDSGMYSSYDVLKIRYQFADYQPSPQPFCGLRYQSRCDQYAPEMP